MDILFKGIARVFRKEPSSTTIYIPKSVSDKMNLTHKEELSITLTECNQILIERVKK